MRRKISFVIATIAVAAVALTHPVVAEAARMITSGDIRNGTIRSVDVKNQTLKSRDIRNETIRSKDVRNGALTDADLAPGAGVSAYARIIPTPTSVSFDALRTKNVTTVTRTAPGVYCLELAAGENRVVAVVASPEGAMGNASAQWTGDCGINGVQITTERLTHGATDVLVSTPDNTVAFHVIVP